MITNTAVYVFFCVLIALVLALWAHWPRSWQRPSKIGKVTFTGRDRHSTCCLFQEMQKFYCYVKSTLFPAKTHHYLIWTYAMHNCFKRNICCTECIMSCNVIARVWRNGTGTGWWEKNGLSWFVQLLPLFSTEMKQIRIKNLIEQQF